MLACLLAAIKSEQVDAVRVRCGSFGGGAIKELSIDQRRFCLFFSFLPLFLLLSWQGKLIRCVEDSLYRRSGDRVSV